MAVTIRRMLLACGTQPHDPVYEGVATYTPTAADLQMSDEEVCRRILLPMWLTAKQDFARKV
jgi:hypothetical protein